MEPGCYTALITPFDQEGNIDEQGAHSVSKVIERHFLEPSRPLHDTEIPEFKGLKLPTKDEALEIFGEVAETDAMPVADLSELFCTATGGDIDAVQSLLAEKRVMVEVAKTDEMFPLFIADCLATVGDIEGSLKWLGQAIDWGFCNVRYLEEFSPFLRPLHGVPRFKELMDEARQKQKVFVD